MALREYEFTLVLSGVKELSQDTLDALYEAGCDDALIGMRDGVAFADFVREAESPEEALQSAIRNIEQAGIGAKVEHIEPDEIVNMSELARRFRISREGVRKWIGGERGPSKFPSPVAGLKQRSPLWRWTDVLSWYKNNQSALRVKVNLEDLIRYPTVPFYSSTKRAVRKTQARLSSRKQPGRQPEAYTPDWSAYLAWAEQIAAYNAALTLRRHVSAHEATRIMRQISARQSCS